jgi:hypothetical protein
MARLRDRTSVDLPIERTKAGLDRFFGSLRERDGVSRIRLRVPTDGPTFGLSIDRAVRIEARPSPNPNSIRVTWTPEGTTVFPTFEGELVVWSDEDPGVTYLELDGAYSPPFGAAGQIFDAAIGQRIAQSTAREFLNDLKEGIERNR